MNDIQKFLSLVAKKFPTEVRGDIYAKGREIYDATGHFLSRHNCLGSKTQVAVAANEAIGFDTIASTGIEDFEAFVGQHVPAAYVRPCMEHICILLNKCLGNGTAGAWAVQNQRADHNDGRKARELSTIYSSSISNELLSSSLPSTEAFGTNIDMAVPDMKVAITVAILNFHTGLVPRMLQTRTTAQPNVAYTKEYLEVYDLRSVDGFRKRLLDLYFDPTLVRNELQKIIPRSANDSDGDFIAHTVTAADGVTPIQAFLKFGISANILKLSLQSGDGADFGHTRINRTDLIEDAVKVESILVALTVGETSESFIVPVPPHVSRLTRMVNATDSAMRNADIRFQAFLAKGAAMANGSVSTLLAGLAADVEGVVLDFVVKPSVSLKFGTTDCMIAVKAAMRHITDDDLLSAAASTLGTALALAGGVVASGYSLDARFSEQNLRKTSIATWSHRMPFSYDIPIGRNYVFDYAIGQANAEQNATNLTKVIRLGQDDVALKLIIDTLERVYDSVKAFESANPINRPEDPGVAYVAGDMVRPYVWQGSLKLNSLNVIRDSDRPGDIKQKAISMLTSVTSRILQKSLFQQQLNGAQPVFNVICSPEALGNVFSLPSIYQHFNKDDDWGKEGGADYVLVLSNNVKLQFIVSTFDYMQTKLVMFPIIPGNAESELNFCHNWDYGTMVAHYTPSAAEAHHRLFANIRELPIVVNPIGAIIDIVGMEVANFLSNENELRPSINVSGTVNGATVVSGTVTTIVDSGTES